MTPSIAVVHAKVFLDLNDLLSVQLGMITCKK